MLDDSKLPTTFWAEAVNTACYVLNRVLVVKPHNKTPYEIFRGGTLALSFIRPFGCHVTILNTLDYLGKFDGKSDDGFFVGYSMNSKAFRVYNIITRKVEENLHIRFLEDKPIIVGDGPKWLFDIDVLTKSMNYVPVVAGTNSNDFVGTEETIGAGHSSKETRSSQDYILMPLWKDGSLFDSYSKNASNDEPQPSSDVGKKDDEGGRYGHDIGVNTASTSINTANINITTAEPVTTASAPVTTAGVSVSTAEPSTPPTIITTPIEDEDITIAQTLIKMKSEKSKAKRVTMQEPSESGIRMKDQIEYDVDVAQRLQAKLDEEARLEREREEEASKATNIAEWDDVQAIMDADNELAAKLQAEEQGEISIEERSEKESEEESNV
ncbi:putative ribonuclease H-like domain-containing protein [Tanacetum coccineum]